MDFLLPFFIVLVSVSAVGEFFLYKVKNEKIKSYIFYFLAFWSIFMVFINVSGLPTNYMLHKFVGISFGALALIGVFINLKNKKHKNIAYNLVSLSVILSTIDILMI